MKFVDTLTGIQVDVYEPCRHFIDSLFRSFNQSGGPVNTNMVKELMLDYPQLYTLTLVLKYVFPWCPHFFLSFHARYFLFQRSLNTPYSGGLGSYGLVLMITRFLQVHLASRFCDSHSRCSLQNFQINLITRTLVSFCLNSFDFMELYSIILPSDLL